ncbi:MAG TPA: glycosyltransferase 87 family protein, partial [Thermoanaerobaculia bacterium]
MRGSAGARRWEARLLVAACLLLVLLRFGLAARAPVLYEIRDVWEPMSRAPGGPPYADPFPYYHFFPPFYWLLHGLRAAAEAAAVPFAAVLRIVLAAADVATALVVASLARRAPGAMAPYRAAALYLASPIAIYVSSVQGQFDGLALLFLLLALWASRREQSPGAAAVETGLLLGASIAAKQVTALHPILWIGRSRVATILLMAAVVPALALLPYASEGA